MEVTPMNDEDLTHLQAYGLERGATVSRTEEGDDWFTVKITSIAGGSERSKHEPVKFTSRHQAEQAIDRIVNRARQSGFLMASGMTA
jgi:hypothetical protein